MVERDPREAGLRKYEGACRAAARRFERLARQVCGPVVGEDDLLVEARVAVVEALAAYAPAEATVPEVRWVRTRIRQRLLDTIRRFNVRSREEIARVRANLSPDDPAFVRRIVSLDELYADTGSFRIPSTTEPPDSGALHSRMVQLLYEAMATLPPRQRMALEQVYLKERTLTDVAADMGLSESRVWQLQRRAIYNLRAILGHISQ